MNEIIELKDDLLVEEGHYLERLQSEALEEGWVHATVRDLESIIQEYGASYVVRLFSTRTKERLLQTLVQ